MTKKKTAKQEVNSNIYQFFPEFPPTEMLEIPHYKEGVKYEFGELPELIQTHLLKLQNEDGDYLKHESEPGKSVVAGIIIACLGFFLLITLFSEGRGWSIGLQLLILPLTFFITLDIFKRYKKKNSPLKPFYLITPTLFIETSYEEVTFWGLHQIKEISKSLLDELVIQLNPYITKKIVLSPTKLSEYFDQLKLWCEEYKNNIEEENFNAIITQNIFYQGPNLSGTVVAKPFRLRFNLRNQIIFSAALSLILGGSLIWVVNKYLANQKEIRLVNEQENRQSNYDRLLIRARSIAKYSKDGKFNEAVIALLENAKLNDNPKVYLLIEGENTISASLENRLQTKLGDEKLIAFPKNITQGNYAASEEKDFISRTSYLFSKYFKNRELVIEELTSRHRKMDLAKDAIITFKYKLEMGEELATDWIEVKPGPANQKTRTFDPKQFISRKIKINYPEMIVSIKAIFEIPNYPQQVFELENGQKYKSPPMNGDGQIYYGGKLRGSFAAAFSDFESRLGRSL
jgi:hypothetical protein